MTATFLLNLQSGMDELRIYPCLPLNISYLQEQGCKIQEASNGPDFDQLQL